MPHLYQRHLVSERPNCGQLSGSNGYPGIELDHSFVVHNTRIVDPLKYILSTIETPDETASCKGLLEQDVRNFIGKDRLVKIVCTNRGSLAKPALSERLNILQWSEAAVLTKRKSSQ